jgi:hypothetical protein
MDAACSFKVWLEIYVIKGLQGIVSVRTKSSRNQVTYCGTSDESQQMQPLPRYGRNGRVRHNRSVGRRVVTAVRAWIM